MTLQQQIEGLPLLNTNIVVSVCVLIDNRISPAREFLLELHPVLQQSYRHFEILVIANGLSEDGLLAWRELLKETPNVRLLVLSRAYDEEVAYTAALENCIGDYVVLMDPCTAPPALIAKMISLCLAGHDYVTGQLAGRRNQPLLYRAMARTFYFIFNILAEQPVENDWSRFICLSRAMVNNIIQVKDRVRYFKSLNTGIGYSRGTIPYDQRGSGGRDRRFWGRLKFAVETIVSSSDRLIRMANLSCLIVSLLNFAYISYAVLIWIFKPDVAPGWTSTSVVLALMFGILFLVVAVLGEYLSVIYKETKKSPLYHVAREYSSSDLFRNITEKNVT